MAARGGAIGSRQGGTCLCVSRAAAALPLLCCGVPRRRSVQAARVGCPPHVLALLPAAAVRRSHARVAALDAHSPLPRVASSLVPQSAPAGKGGAVPDTSALIAFNARFRAAGEEKDAKEREAKAARRAAGKAALKKMTAERAAAADARKARNRAEEAATERAMLDALQGETWTRVVSLIDIHGGGAGGAAAGAAGKADAAGGAGGKAKAGAAAAPSAAAAAGGKGGAGGEDAACARMRDVLIGLKAKPPQAA